MSEAVVSKGEFARLINVSPGRVSQMIAERKIPPEALEGEGRTAKVRVELAKRFIASRTDIGQRTGNGLTTKLAPAAGGEGAMSPTIAAPVVAAAPPEPVDLVTEAIKQARLNKLTLENERAAEERLAERGRYVRADQAKAAMAKMAQAIMTVFEGGLGDLATAISAEHGIAARDVLHVLRTEFRQVRARAAESFRREAAGLPAALRDEVADASDQAVGQA